jgi:hypothetical protein
MAVELAEQPFPGQGSEGPVDGGEAYRLATGPELVVELFGGGVIGASFQGVEDQLALPGPP